MKKPRDVIQPRWGVYMLKREAERMPFTVTARDGRASDRARDQGIRRARARALAAERAAGGLEVLSADRPHLKRAAVMRRGTGDRKRHVQKNQRKRHGNRYYSSLVHRLRWHQARPRLARPELWRLDRALDPDIAAARRLPLALVHAASKTFSLLAVSDSASEWVGVDGSRRGGQGNERRRRIRHCHRPRRRHFCRHCFGPFSRLSGAR